jgi:hypothetical protein
MDLGALREYTRTYQDIPSNWVLKSGMDLPFGKAEAQWQRLGVVHRQIPKQEWDFYRRTKEGRQFLRNILFYFVGRGRSVVQEVPFSDEILVLRKPRTTAT